MKNIILAILAAAAVIFSVQAEETKYRDAESLAQAYLLHNASYYIGYVDGQQFTNGAYVPLQMTFRAGRDLMITNLQVNGTEIRLTKPLPGLPVPENGMAYMSVSLSAMDKDGELGAYGSYWTNMFYRTDKLVVPMEPITPPVFVPFPSDNPDQLTLRLTGADSWGWYYEREHEGFSIQIGAGWNDVQYAILDMDGNVLQTGSIQSFKGSTENPETPLNVGQLGNVREARLNDGYKSLFNQNFDCLVTRDGAPVPAKVYNVPDVNRRRLAIFIQGLGQGTVEVRKPLENGELLPVPMTVSRQGEKGVQFITIEPVDKVVVTVLPDEDAGPFGVAFNRWY